MNLRTCFLFLIGLSLILSCKGGAEIKDTPCCLAACVSTLGQLTFVDRETDATIHPKGTLTIEDDLTKETIYSNTLNDSSDPTIYLISDHPLANYEGRMISVAMAIDVVGYQPYEEVHEMKITRASICCSSCLQSSTKTEVRLTPI